MGPIGFILEVFTRAVRDGFTHSRCPSRRAALAARPARSLARAIAPPAHPRARDRRGDRPDGDGRGPGVPRLAVSLRPAGSSALADALRARGFWRSWAFARSGGGDRRGSTSCRWRSRSIATGRGSASRSPTCSSSRTCWPSPGRRPRRPWCGWPFSRRARPWPSPTGERSGTASGRPCTPGPCSWA